MASVDFKRVQVFSPVCEHAVTSRFRTRKNSCADTLITVITKKKRISNSCDILVLSNLRGPDSRETINEVSSRGGEGTRYEDNELI